MLPCTPYTIAWAQQAGDNDDTNGSCLVFSITLYDYCHPLSYEEPGLLDSSNSYINSDRYALSGLGRELIREGTRMVSCTFMTRNRKDSVYHRTLSTSIVLAQLVTE